MKKDTADRDGKVRECAIKRGEIEREGRDQEGERGSGIVRETREGEIASEKRSGSERKAVEFGKIGADVNSHKEEERGKGGVYGGSPH